MISYSTVFFSFLFFFFFFKFSLLFEILSYTHNAHFDDFHVIREVTVAIIQNLMM